MKTRICKTVLKTVGRVNGARRLHKCVRLECETFDVKVLNPERTDCNGRWVLISSLTPKLLSAALHPNSIRALRIFFTKLCIAVNKKRR